MIRTMLVALEVDDRSHPNADNIDVDLTVARMAVPTDEDLADGLRARLDEFYPTDDQFPFVPRAVRVAVVGEQAAEALLQAAMVGLDSAEDAGVGFTEEVLDEANAAVELLLPEPDEDGAPCCPDPGCEGRAGGECTFPGYAANH